MSRRLRIRRIALTVSTLAALGAGMAWWRGVPPERDVEQALAALQQGDPGPALRTLAWMERRPELEPHALLLRGAVSLRRGNPEGALRDFALVEPAGALREPGFLLTAECLYSLGRLAEAEAILRQLLSEHPDHVAAHRWLGAIYFDLGANNVAIAVLERLAELDPDDHGPHRLMGLMSHDFEDHSQAIAHYRAALKRAPPAPVRQEILAELAKSQIAQREYEEALATLAEAQPQALVLALRSECHWSLGEGDVAERLLRDAASLNPANRAVLLLEARILMETSRAAEAVAPLQRLLRGDPHDAEARYQLALAYRHLDRLEDHEAEMRRWADSKELLDRLTELNVEAIRRPSDADLRRQLAQLCDQLGKHELAAMWRSAAAGYQGLPSSAQPSRETPHDVP